MLCDARIYNPPVLSAVWQACSVLGKPGKSLVGNLKKIAKHAAGLRAVYSVQCAVCGVHALLNNVQ